MLNIKMKKVSITTLQIASALILIGLQDLNCQVYDGIAQPKAYRIFADNNNKMKPFMQVSRRFWLDSAQTLSTCAVYSYMFKTDQHVVESWNNLNLFERTLWLLSRTGYNINNKGFYETLSFSYLLPYNFMVDCTWYNAWTSDRKNFSEEMQLLGGYKLPGYFVFNCGYRFVGKTKSTVFNLRLLLVDTFQWLQFRYVPKDELFDIKVYIHFDDIIK